jgi:hypothetical protein
MHSQFQLIQGGRVTPKHVRESVHAQAVNLGHGLQAVAKRNGIGYGEVLDLCIEQERLLAAKREKAAYQAGRLSLWKVAA